MTQPILAPAEKIAQELNAKPSQVEAAIRLLDEGATVPFIARYRKEATQGLDDGQLRRLAERLDYLRELDERRTLIIKTIREQAQLTPQLEHAILTAETKTRLEDLYLPYRPKRRTKAHLAKEAGLEPLALSLWQDPTLVPEAQALTYLNPEQGIVDSAAALEGARQILMEKFAEDADLVEELRQYLWQHIVLHSTGAKGKNSKNSKFSDYFNYQEPIKKIPSHRALALFRGRRESELRLSLSLPDDPEYGEKRLAAHFKIEDQGRAADRFLMEVVRQSWKVKLLTKLEMELLNRLRELADEEAIKVFAGNLRDLLLAAPAGHQVTIGLDPGIRTGVKAVVVDQTGKLLDYATLFPFAPQNEWHDAIATLAKMIVKHQAALISIGNGTASRDTERLVADVIKMYPDLHVKKVVVNEAGASVYSASELAAQEFPDLDVSLRGAVSIARRLQDPLAELVKIDPKSIGVGQYQHDVNQARLARSLEAVVEDCVNAIGVDLNTASVALLTRVSGFNESLAKNLVQYRDEHGAFRNRTQLKHVPRMGEKSFQQAAGFLRITQGENPLDASAVHPEAYPLVERILADQKVDLNQIIGHHALLKSVNAANYVDDQYGLPTVVDVLHELEKPGRDPRPEFKTAQFTAGIEEMSQLKEGMILEGVVSNVTNFGAFVDIGVHQDGLVHISAITNRFIRDPRSVIKAGDIVRVKVTELDEQRRRIGLSMRLDENASPASHASKQSKSVTSSDKQTPKSVPRKKMQKKQHAVKPASTQKPMIFNTTMADALAKLKPGRGR